jgi:hypothetical protein
MKRHLERKHNDLHREYISKARTFGLFNCPFVEDFSDNKISAIRRPFNDQLTGRPVGKWFM